MLAPNVLLIANNNGVSPDTWRNYTDHGLRSVCGEWVPNWHQVAELHLDRCAVLEDRQAPYVEVFRGADALIASPLSENEQISGD